MIVRVALVVVLLASARARAEGVASSGLPVPSDGYGLLGVDRAQTDAPGDVGLRLSLDYRRRPLRLDLDQRRVIVANEVELRAGLAVGVWKRLALGVWVPVSLAGYSPAGVELATGAAGAATRYDVASGDIRLFLKVQAVRHRVVGFSILGALIFPSGDRESWRSNGQWGGDLRLTLDITWRWLGLVANLGAREQPTEVKFMGARVLAIGPELTWGAAFVAELRSGLWLAVEAVGSESLLPLTAAARTAAVLLSMRVRAASGLELTFGLGRSLDENAARGDDVRLMTALSWHPLAARSTGPDRDGDGVPDARDRCPDDPEDRDGFADDDGCPDADNDGDGLEDRYDRCPNDPEDHDGFQDGDGCPDTDNDGDRVPDGEDWCPNQFGDVDNEGCPGDVQVPAPSPKPREVEAEPPPVLFDENQSTLSPMAERAATRLADYIFRHTEILRVRLEGHADPGERNPEALSVARAQAVLRLVAKRGVDPWRLLLAGYGANRPASKRAEENRRVEWIVVDAPK
jgi:outer membrane protein OmpA-like peptidoglycan-associated protein